MDNRKVCAIYQEKRSSQPSFMPRSWRTLAKLKRCKACFDDAMKIALQSLYVDINSGFQFIHIDPCIFQDSNFDLNNCIQRTTQLIEKCLEYADKRGKKVFFEVGAEGHASEVGEESEFRYFAEEVLKFCQQNKLSPPMFFVAKVGTFVKENKNYGALALKKHKNDENAAKRLIKVANDFSIKIKQHNADYLSSKTLHFFHKIGVHALNIAPEFGVRETKYVLEKLREYSWLSDREKLIQSLTKSNKWSKWVFENKQYDDEFLAMLIGHYFFSSPFFLL